MQNPQGGFTRLHFLLLILLLIVGSYVYVNKESADIPEVVKKIYSESSLSKNSKIDECTKDGEIYFSTSANGYDGGGTVYDINGKVVGGYGGITGESGGILPTDCEVIYVPEDNIWDIPAVDKYHLKWFLEDTFLNSIIN